MVHYNVIEHVASLHFSFSYLSHKLGVRTSFAEQAPLKEVMGDHNTSL